MINKFYTSPQKTVILRGGGLGPCAGVSTQDRSKVPSTWNISDNIQTVVFDSNMAYFRKIYEFKNYQITLSGKGQEDAISQIVLASGIATSETSAFCIGKESSQLSYTLYPGLCTSNACRIISFNANISGGNLTVSILDKYCGNGISSQVINVDVTVYSF